jgi:hypothetical protein
MKSRLPVALTLLAAGTPRPSRPRRPRRLLTVVLSPDRLSWSRPREHHRPWCMYRASWLLEEAGQTGARYRHLNTETSPGHAPRLATGASLLW